MVSEPHAAGREFRPLGIARWLEDRQVVAKPTAQSST
jgi:hypothetical protein